MRQNYILSHAEAAKIVAAIQQEVEKDGKGAAIAVADAHGELLAFLRTDGCPFTSITIAINKAYVAARERMESKALGEKLKRQEAPVTNYGDPRFLTWGGGVPIMYQGQVVGAIGVSGLPEEEDMVLARMGAALIKQE